MAARRVYSEEFKREAVQRWLDSGQSATSIEEELGISQGLLGKWKQALGIEPAPGVGEGEPAEEISPIAEPTEGEPVMEKETAEVVAGAEGELADAPEEREPVKAEPAQPEVEPELEPKGEKVGPGRGVAIAKRIAGTIAILLGGLGILLALALLIGTWVANTPVTEGALNLLVAVEEGLVAADAGLETADAALERVDAALTRVNQRADEVAALLPGEEILQVIDDVQAIFDVVQSTTEATLTMIDALSSMPLVGRQVTPPDLPKLEETLLTMSEISDQLVIVEQRLRDFQVNGRTGPLVQLQANLNQLQGRLAGASTRVANATASIQQLQEDVPGWIDWISIALTLLFLWLGVAQYSLLVNGLGWLRRP